MQNKNTYYVAPLLTVVTSLKNNFATVRTSYLHIIAYLANTRSLMNGKTYIWKFSIKPEVDFKRLSSPTFGPTEPENVLL